MTATRIGRPLHVVERNALAYRRLWKIFMTGFFDPVLFLFSIGVGVGGLVGDLEVAGRTVPYESFVAPALMATSCMNGTVFDVTFNFFFKYKYSKTFDAMLATPLGVMDVAVGEMGWALLRGTIYSTSFLIVMTAMGLVESPWAVLCVPATMLLGFGFAGLGMAATTYMRSFIDFDKVNLALIPLFLFSATFFPLSRYPDVAQWFVQATPLYQGVALLRSLTLGDINWAMAGHVAYLAAMGTIGVRITAVRLAKLLQP